MLGREMISSLIIAAFSICMHFVKKSQLPPPLLSFPLWQL